MEYMGYKGDNDPLDAVELGFEPLERGSVTYCQLVGAIGLIDQDEIDWKILLKK